MEPRPALGGVPRTDEPPADPPGADMTFLEHLEELRRRLVLAAIGVGVATALMLFFARQLFEIIMAPVVEELQAAAPGPDALSMVFISPAEPFVVYLKTGLLAGLFIASPWVFYQLWLFVAPGLYDHERSMAIPFALASAAFFVLGGVFCYTMVFPLGIRFFIGLTGGTIAPMLTMDRTFNFAVRLILAFALIFELPIAITLLARVGVVTPEFLRRNRRYFIVLAFVTGAILTPPDAITQISLAIPLVVLYELSVIVAAWVAPASPLDDDEP